MHDILIFLNSLGKNHTSFAVAVTLRYSDLAGTMKAATTIITYDAKRSLTSTQIDGTLVSYGYDAASQLTTNGAATLAYLCRWQLQVAENFQDSAIFFCLAV